MDRGTRVGGDAMLILPAVQRNLALLQVLGPEPKCLDPGLLRSQLQSLAQALETRVMTEAATEMNLMTQSGVSSETALGPFLDTAYTMFVSGGLFIRQIRSFFQMSLTLIGTQSDMELPGRSPLYACRNTRLIQSRLRTIDERLVGLLDAFRQRFMEFDQDAQRIRRLMNLPLSQRPPQQPTPPGTLSGPGLRVMTDAERAALAMIGTFRQQMAAIAQLMREALQEIMPSVAAMPVASAIIRRALSL